jgi:hypothetical protein
VDKHILFSQAKRAAEAARDISNLAVANVHGNFKAETHFGNFWLGPHIHLLDDG